MGGNNKNQTIEYVRSFDSRSWSCLHVFEGSMACNSVLVQNNDIGPCGTDLYQQWADGISVSCQNTIVRNNMIQAPTDGGIVLFGSPGSQVYNNTIWITNVRFCQLGRGKLIFDNIFRIHCSAVLVWSITNRGWVIIPEQRSLITLSLEVLPM